MENCFIPSFGMVETSHSDRFYMLYVSIFGDSPGRIGLLAKKGMKDIKVFFSHNIFMIKQTMLLTFLRLLRIVRILRAQKKEL